MASAATSAGPVSLFVGQVPAVSSDPDTQAVELGVRFSSDVSGSVTDLRFYKGTSNTGIHTGSLWTAGGTRLATATFTNWNAGRRCC